MKALERVDELVVGPVLAHCAGTTGGESSSRPTTPRRSARRPTTRPRRRSASRHGRARGRPARVLGARGGGDRRADRSGARLDRAIHRLMEPPVRRIMWHGPGTRPQVTDGHVGKWERLTCSMCSSLRPARLGGPARQCGSQQPSAGMPHLPSTYGEAVRLIREQQFRVALLDYAIEAAVPSARRTGRRRGVAGQRPDGNHSAHYARRPRPDTVALRELRVRLIEKGSADLEDEVIRELTQGWPRIAATRR